MPSNLRNSYLPFSSSDSSEIKKGNLVFIQNASTPSSPAMLPLSPTTNYHTGIDTAPQSRAFKRLPVVVKIHCKSSKNFAVVNFVGRQQICSPPVYISLKKYNVHHPGESKRIDLIPIDMEGLTLTFEATTPVKASEWAMAFGRQKLNVFGDVNRKTPLTNLLEIISEEIGTADNVTDNNKRITELSCDSTLHGDTFNTDSAVIDNNKRNVQFTRDSSLRNPKNSPVVRHSSSFRPTFSPKSFSSSRHQLLPVLSEQEDESLMEADDDCLRGC